VKEKQHWGFIINPVAGNGYARKYADRVFTKIAEFNLNAEVMFTEGRGHAQKIAESLIQKGCSTIIAVGGDGTFNETARAILPHDEVTFGIVSAGTGNDFAPVLGFSEHFNDADWDVLMENNIIRMDIGKCNENYFLNGMGLGFDAQVAAENFRPDMVIKSRSKTKYFWHIIKNLLLYKERIFRADIDGRHREAMTFMYTIAIGRRFGGGYFITPKAIANDGMFDVCLVEPLNLLQRFRLFTLVPTGSHLGHEHVNYFQTDKLKLDFDESVPHHLDGELFFSNRFEVSLLPQKMKMIYNPYGKHFFKL